MVDYPEHDKLAERSEEHFAIMAFVEHISSNGLVSSLTNGEWSKIIADYFDIDAVEFEAEKDRMLEALRKTIHA